VCLLKISEFLLSFFYSKSLLFFSSHKTTSVKNALKNALKHHARSKLIDSFRASLGVAQSLFENYSFFLLSFFP